MGRLCGDSALVVLRRTGQRLSLVLGCVAYSTVAQVSVADQFPIIEIDSLPAETIVVDVRSLENCEEASLPGAKCIPLDKLLGSNGRLANLRDIRWLLGTAGLTGEETIALFSLSDKQRDAATAIFFLAGQAKILRLGSNPGYPLNAKGAGTAPSRAMFYSAMIRTANLVPAKGYSVKAEDLAWFLETLNRIPQAKFQWPVVFLS